MSPTPTPARLALTAAFLAALMLALPACAPPPRLTRADSFFGMHFDFHAGADCKEIGRNTTPEMVNRIIDLVHPDYLQIDCKGHPGLSSYPTKVGNQAPGFVGDPLKVWREVTAARGVALYMHYSGVWDSKAVARHPDWAVRGPDGKPDAKATSVFGPYADELLIPQLRELARDYGVDGAWVDGECWATVPDYGDAAVAAFRKATGITNVPREPTDPHYFEFMQFHREAFRQYLRHYIAAVKQTDPTFQICSNWAFTDHMAEPVSAPVDFLSGDYSPQDSVNSARLSARFFARQGKPWDLMAWSFSTQPDRRQKSAVQLEREAAVVLAMGGGFEAYFKQKRDGSIYDEQMPAMAEVAAFCRARQGVVHHAVAVPQVGLLLSQADHYHRIKGLFNRDFGCVHGALQALLETQHSVEVLGEHQLAGRLAEYPILVVPECDYLEPSFMADFVAYAKAGGNVLLVGPGPARLFAEHLGATLEGDARAGAPFRLISGDTALDLQGQVQAATLLPGTRPFGTLRPGATATANAAAPPLPAASIAALGKGKIAAVYFTAGSAYLKGRPEPLRRFLAQVVHELFPQPLVTVTGSADVDVCVARNHGRLLVNLVNTAGPHQTQSILAAIPPVGPLQVTVRTPAAPAAVTLEPGARRLDFAYEDGQVRVTVPRVEIHEIVALQP